MKETQTIEIKEILGDRFYFVNYVTPEGQIGVKGATIDEETVVWNEYNCRKFGYDTPEGKRGFHVTLKRVGRFAI